MFYKLKLINANDNANDRSFLIINYIITISHRPTSLHHITYKHKQSIIIP